MYQLDPTAARQADEGSLRITEIGKYVGTLKRAEDITSTKGTRGIDCEFETPEQHIARFTLWTRNNEGKKIFGFKQLQALMTCLHVTQLNPTSATAARWDRDARAWISVDVQIFDALMHKPIGILFETEEYKKQDGSPGTKVVPAAFFEPQTERMASEILDKKVQPQQLARRIPLLKHRPLRPPVTVASPAPAADVPDDDIPF